MWQPKRDFVGYANNPPKVEWPNGARLAINFVMNYEEGSEPSIQDGEGFSETGLTEAHGLNQAGNGRDLAAEGMFEYGSRVGFWRLQKLFEDRGLPLTIFGCALALERNPLAAEKIRNMGYDVCCHGWRWIKHYELAPAEEKIHIEKAIQSLIQTIGERPLGWYCRYGPSVNTRRLVVQEGGFLYDSDSYADELPFWQVVEDKPHLVVPYSLTNNDGKYAGWMGTSDQWFGFIKDAVDTLYEEGKHHPKMMSVGLHMRLIGHPARSAGLQRLLDYVSKKSGIWVTSRLSIAKHWHEQHPFTG